ncbi:MAG: tRNA (adenosine(37)-N6)-dimethylallyltransferase MiaA [Rhodospirillales bacterium]|nr:tRNA (adenosine(37)-N6)-dimethylallyltransferase MiaA [Alphaproteobacteria bacterium]USO03849.1 MAG: tRNA (adenosine(37)-N6)-dimethylallyltransferase MiaA [Rhodospirillales bacterium]
MPSKKTVHIIGGPTASGKSALALKLAAERNGVILNADSMQVYDALPILTAQPSEEDKEQAPHDLYGALHPNESCSAGNWREMVISRIAQILEEGHTPIVVGGSGLYLKALTEGLSPIPDIPEDIRRAAAARQKEMGNPAFHAALEKRDPVMARRFHPYHTARLVRAWEVLEATGKTLAEWQKHPRLRPPDAWKFEITLVLPERDTLRERCDQRFLRMLENGAAEEAEAFMERLDKGEVHESAPIVKALGFRALRDWISGQTSKEEAIEKASAQTRQYAKRQVTWFRNQVDPDKIV